MDIKHKLSIVERAIQSVSRHDDEDSVVISAALTRIEGMVQKERERIAAKHEAASAALGDGNV